MRELPTHGLDQSKIMELLDQAKKNDVDWKHGKIWGLVYYGGEKHTDLLMKAYGTFFSENPLGPSAFPSLRKLEAEVVAMVLSLLGGDDRKRGSMSSGGTESIILSVKAHRDYFRGKRANIRNPEMIVPATAHPAFLKAAHYLNVKPVVVPVGCDFRADINVIENACNENTILIVASAPSYPQGVVDPVRQIGSLALRLNVGLHVDACLGGFFLPFLKRLGYNIPDYDFTVPGVTSISADLHKYGFAPKGASAILYRDADLFRSQFFINTDWPGGLYASPTMLGTRSGGTIAAAWTALMSLGEDGYLSLVKRTIEGARRVMLGINEIPGLQISGSPDMSVFSFTSKTKDIFKIANAMEKKSWRVSRQNNPASLHMIVTPNHLQIIDDFLEDLRKSAFEVPDGIEPGALANRVELYGGESEDSQGQDLTDYLYGKLEANYRI